MDCGLRQQLWNRRQIPIRVANVRVAQVMHEPEYALIETSGMFAPPNQDAAGVRVAQIMKARSRASASAGNALHQFVEGALDNTIR